MERVRKKRPVNPESEDAIQRAVFEHLRVRGAPGILAFHPKNGGIHQRGRRAGINSGLGVVSGIPDVIVVKPAVMNGLLYGLTYALELKKRKELGGKTSEDQDTVIERLAQAGAIVAVAYGLDAAIKQLEDWKILRGKAA